MTRKVRNSLAALCTGVLIFTLLWTIIRIYPESSPVARGANYAESKNCTECHGDPDNSFPDSKVGACFSTNRRPSHPDYKVDCSDAMAYFEAVRIRRNFNDRAKAETGGLLISGERLVRKYHCFQCHGELGQGGFKNLKSLKGYIPGYFGNDFRVLTRDGDPDSVREWIANGLDHEIIETPFIGKVAEFYFDRQAINMPKYNSLDSEEIETLVNYVIAINQYGPMTADVVRSYGVDSQSAK